MLYRLRFGVRLLSWTFCGSVALFCIADPCHGALAQLTGGSGYSGTLSANKSIRKQQLICDPSAASMGSTSTTYDPSVVTLQSVYNEDGYLIDGANSYVGVDVPVSGQMLSIEELVTLNTFFQSGGNYAEHGYVQIHWGTSASALEGMQSFGLSPDLPTFDTLAHAGVTGGNTHALIFGYLDVPDETIATYTNYADAGGIPLFNGGVSQPDVLYTDDGTPITAPDLSSATVSGPLPEPTALAPLAVATCGILLQRRRRHRGQ